MTTGDSPCPETLHECDHVRVEHVDGEVVIRIKINSTSDVSPASNVTPITKVRGTRIPDDFAPTDDTRQWARQNIRHVHPGRELEKFKNFWEAKAGADARKVDWQKTLRNWLLRAEEDAINRTGGSMPGPTGQRATPPGGNGRLYTPPAPPPEIADDPEAYAAWCARHRAEHRQQQAAW
jgi:hypothetical protein